MLDGTEVLAIVVSRKLPITLGDVVTISCPTLGSLRNNVRLSTECPPWTFGAAQLMRHLAQRGLL